MFLHHVVSATSALAWLTLFLVMGITQEGYVIGFFAMMSVLLGGLTGWYTSKLSGELPPR